MQDEDQTETTDNTSVTVAKTLWSETVIELLLAALDKNKADPTVIELLKDVKKKGFKNDYIISKVEKSLDSTAAARTRRLLAGL